MSTSARLLKQTGCHIAGKAGTEKLACRGRLRDEADTKCNVIMLINSESDYSVMLVPTIRQY